MSRVLVIEDDPRHRELMTTLLDRAQYEVRVAGNGRLGLRAAAKDPPDLVLLNLYLPDMDGYEVCRRLRQGSRTRLTPIVIITASDDPALNGRACAAGAEACIPKPFRYEAFLSTVETVLAGVGRRISLPKVEGQRVPPAAPKRGTAGWKVLQPYRGHQVWVRDLSVNRWVAAVTPLFISGGPTTTPSPPDESIVPAAFESKAAAVQATRVYLNREEMRRTRQEGG